MTRRTDRFGAFAHIVADKPGGPRGNAVRSPKLANDIGNLMLLCHKHHKLIDGANWQDYPESLLRVMKAEHEARVRKLSSYQGEYRTHLLLLQAGIGERVGWLSRQAAETAVLPRYAQDHATVDLSRSRIRDGEELFWRTGIAGCREILVIGALPNSLAVEYGRVLLPKVHPPMVLYDQHNTHGGLNPTITLHGGQVSLANRPT